MPGRWEQQRGIPRSRAERPCAGSCRRAKRRKSKPELTRSKAPPRTVQAPARGCHPAVHAPQSKGHRGQRRSLRHLAPRWSSRRSHDRETVPRASAGSVSIEIAGRGRATGMQRKRRAERALRRQQKAAAQLTAQRRFRYGEQVAAEGSNRGSRRRRRE